MFINGLVKTMVVTLKPFFFQSLSHVSVKLVKCAIVTPLRDVDRRVYTCRERCGVYIVVCLRTTFQRLVTADSPALPLHHAALPQDRRRNRRRHCTFAIHLML